jgi:(1->4)-alpha-D-glucan 1-alpha-D-glucosylmutase
VTLPDEAPIASYRLQLTPELGFAAAARLIPYLARLGISHVYLSPILQAAAGSTHGYDVIDHGRVSTDLGGDEAYLRFSRELSSHGLKQMVDIVPNHMSIGDRRNRWWWDVLENGPASRYADSFDVDWDPPEGRNRNVVLMPILADHRGLVLDRRELRVEREGARFTFRYFEHSLPVAPRSLATVLSSANQRLMLLPVAEHRTSEQRARAIQTLAFLADSFGNLPSPTRRDTVSTIRRHRDKDVLQDLLAAFLEATPEAAACVDQALVDLNEDTDALDSFLNQQNHRIAYWRTAERELDYRRFFDVTSLIGLRVEDEGVFEDTHRLIGRFVRDGLVHGLRVDHIDGLVDAAQYLTRLRALAPRAWIVVEKILVADEQLRRAWPVEGTTGYDFLNDVLGLFINPAAETAFTALYREVTGVDKPFEAIARVLRERVLREALAADVDRLVQLLVELCAASRMHRDWTRHELRQAVRTLVASFPVYRTYVRFEAGASVVDDDDARTVVRALELSLAARPDLDPRLFALLHDLLLGRSSLPGAEAFTLRFQQLTSPTVAKGIEDTAFYNYARLIALNEVGGDPGRFGSSIAHFHGRNLEAAARTPLRMTTTSTHDTKRSEDVRARLAVLSDHREQWARWVRDWRQHNEPKRSAEGPEAETELYFYQTLLGAWPLPLDRALAHMMKAVREAKVFTSWTKPDPVYEDAARAFIEACYADAVFLEKIEAAAGALAEPGRVCSMAQLLLKLTSPGVPDIYQGTELWSLDLVDPDNRRPVDFALRERLLEEAIRASPEDLLARLDEGLPKMALIHRTLGLRRRRPELFDARGGYEPLFAAGEHADHVVAFCRGGGAAVVVPRRFTLPPLTDLLATVPLPPGSWRNVLTSEEHRGGEVDVSALLRRFPVALLERSALEGQRADGKATEGRA